MVTYCSKVKDISKIELSINILYTWPLFYVSDLACTFPFTGTWVTSNRGTWTVTSDSIQNFKLRVDVAADSLWIMECFSTDGTYYILK